MGVSFTGAWTGLKRKLENAAAWIMPPALEVLVEAGEQVGEEVHKRMLSSPPPPLASSTVLRKQGEGAPEPKRSWYEWGELAGIPMVVELTSRSRRKSEVRVGHAEDVIHRGSGLPANTVAKFLEHGTVNMPPRPVYGPLIVDLRSGKHPLSRMIKRTLAERITSTF